MEQDDDILSQAGSFLKFGLDPLRRLVSKLVQSADQTGTRKFDEIIDEAKIVQLDSTSFRIAKPGIRPGIISDQGQCWT